MSHEYRLDLLRLAAALFVVIGHLSIFGVNIPDYGASGDELAFGWLQPVGWFGWIGVQIFFVISGYVIAASAIGNDSGRFLKKRAIRVFPALWLCSLIALGIRLAWGEAPGVIFPSFLRSIVLSPKGPYIDGVVWTLILEGVFYLLIAGLIYNRLDPSVKSAALEVGALALGGASSVFLLIALFVETLSLSINGELLADTLDRFPFKVMLLWHGVFFALGMLLRSIRQNGITPIRLYASLLFAAMGVVEIFLKSDANPALLPVTIWACAIAVVILPIPWKTERRPQKNRVWMKQLGLLTYPLYLNHFTVGMYLTPMLSPWCENRAILLLIVVTVIIGSSTLIVLGPERRLHDLGRRILLARRDVSFAE